MVKAGKAVVYSADGKEELPSDWTGVAQGAAGMTKWWLIGQSGGERSLNALQAKTYAEALEEAKSINVDAPIAGVEPTPEPQAEPAPPPKEPKKPELYAREQPDGRYRLAWDTNGNQVSPPYATKEEAESALAAFKAGGSDLSKPFAMPSDYKATRPEALRSITSLGNLLGKSQLAAVKSLMSGEEAQFFIDKMVELDHIAQTMPKSYEQDGKGDQAIAYQHYFRGGSDWYITEADKGADDDGPNDKNTQAFGFTVLNGDVENAEMGYINIRELTSFNVELDFHWTPKTIGEIKKSLGIGEPEPEQTAEVTPEPTPEPTPAPAPAEPVAEVVPEPVATPANDPPPANDAPVTNEAALATLNSSAESSAADADVSWLRSVIAGDAVLSGKETVSQLKGIAKNRPDLAGLVKEATAAYSARVIARARQLAA